MAETKTTEKTKSAATNASAKSAKREDIYIERGYDGDDPNLFVCVNGVTYVLPKGKTSNVPWYVAKEIRRSRGAQEVMDEHVDQMTAKPSGASAGLPESV